MVGKGSLTCAKCGITSKEDSSLSFHRFPRPSVQGTLKARVWAMFCYPNSDWTSDQSLLKLYKQHKMMCGKHFDGSSFTSSDRSRLNKFAIPTGACHILAQLREDTNTTHKQMDIVPPSTSLPDTGRSSTVQTAIVSASTSQDLQMDIVQPSTSLPDTGDSSMVQTAIVSASTSQDLQKSGKVNKIMKEMEVKTLAELTPRKRKLYKRCRNNLSEILRLRRKFKKVKKKDRDIISCLQSDNAVNDIIKSKLSSSFYLLLQSQLQNGKRKLHGRRWTLDDKVLALSIYKKSTSCYKLLRRLFYLPSISSLKTLLNKIPMVCGINEQVIQTIQEITAKRTTEHNMCVLAFDEMSIKKNLTYNTKLDQIEGYQDHAGQGRTCEIASKALTFMAIGVRKNWKQPIAFYFSGAYVTADRLAVIIKEVLSACFSAGLCVVGTVCDCDGVNVRALNTLGSSTDKPFFDHEGHEIVTIIDPPHLLKCFRNNFMKHNITFPHDVHSDGQQKTGIAKWSHIEQFYEMEKSNANFVFAPALTQQHIQPNGKQKMKVKLAAQVLSHSVAAGIYARVAQNELPQAATATATVVSKLDSLFDAMNGNTPDQKRGKPFLTNMSSTSPHLKLFKEMKFFFTEMQFSGSRSKPPSQEGWLRTLNAMERLFSSIQASQNIKSLSLRRLNQDPLENCFGCIRSNCGSNPNPTSVQFVAALKTGIITNLINNNQNRNCLDDSNNLLDNFKVFLTSGNLTRCSNEQKDISTHDPEADCLDENVLDVVEDNTPYCSGEMQACAYVCGFIVKKLKLECEACKNVFLVDQNSEVCHLFSTFKEYDEKVRLNYVQAGFVKLVDNAATLVNKILNEKAHINNIKSHLIDICNASVNFECLQGCQIHQQLNKNSIIRHIVTICINRFCVLRNRMFVEDASKQSMARKIKILKNL